MVDKQKIVVILLIVAIVFSVISAVLTLSLMNVKQGSVQPSGQLKVVYGSGQVVQGNPNGGVSLYVQPSGGNG